MTVTGGVSGTYQDKGKEDEVKYRLTHICIALTNFLRYTKKKEINATAILHQRLRNQIAIQKVVPTGIRKNPAS